MSLVKLVFKGVSDIVAADDVGLLMLTTEDMSRQISIICDHAMVYQFGLRTAKAEITPKLLPEVLWQVVTRNVELRFQIVINDLIDGQYRTLLYMPDILQAIPVRASDGVLLAVIADLPIFIEEKLLMRQGVPYKEGNVGVAVPVNVITDEMLAKALQQAVEDEDYEKASQIRDELKRRGGKEYKP